ncbi:MAG: hypothetical protein ACOVQG_07385 [Crocinitomicaceae bacterium]|jgi:hypothetical protein
MSFDGNEGKVVSLEEAAIWTANFRNSIQPGETIAHFIGKNKLLELLEQENCVGVRIYYGLDENGEENLVFVGADEDENDLVDGVILEYAAKCPPKCSNTNDLNI